MTSDTVVGAGGARLRTRLWPAGEPRGAVVVVHGFGEHSGRYVDVARFLTDRGWSVFAYDQRGHGESEGRRGRLRDFGVLLDDLDAVIADAERHPAGSGRPFLLGHSMGGLVVIRYLQTRGPACSGAVLSAPWLGTAVPVPWWKRLMAAVLRHLAPDLTVPTGMDAVLLTRDPDAQRAYREDPLVHGRVSTRLFDEVVDAQHEALSGGLPVPSLVLVPGDDGVADAERTLGWARGLPGDADVVTLEGLRHEPFQEPEKEAVLTRVAAWLDEVVDSPA